MIETVDLCGVAHRVIDNGDEIAFEEVDPPFDGDRARITFYKRLGGKWYFRLDPENALAAVEVVVEARKIVEQLQRGKS